jgi:putative transposase
VFCDATYVKGRVNGRVVSRAVVIATGVTATGDREVLGVDVGDSEDGAFWTAFLQGLRARGLAGVQLVISDHHLGLKAAIVSVFIGAAWQRCRVHFMRNVLAKVPKASAEMVAAAIRTIFAQPDATHVRAQLDEVARMLAGQFPDVATMLHNAVEDVLSFTNFPTVHCARSGPPTPSSARTEKSSVAPTSSGSSPTTRRSLVSSPPCASRPTTNGPSLNAATSPKNPWPSSTSRPSRNLSNARRRPLPSAHDTLTHDAEHHDVELHHSAGRDHRRLATLALPTGQQSCG